MLKRAAALLLVCASTATWIACGTTASHFVYAAVPAVNQIAVFRQDPNSGVLTAIAGTPYTVGLGVRSLVLHPSKKFLYAANANESTVSRFTVANDGTLAEKTPRTPAGTTPWVAAMDPAGAFLYVVNQGSNDLSVFSISSSDGSLAPIAGSPFPIGVSPLSMELSASGNFLYVGGQGAKGFVEVFSLTAGVPTPIQAPALTGATAGPFGMEIDPAGTHLFTVNAASDSSISEFSIDSTGALTLLPNFPLSGSGLSNPLAVLVVPSGKFLYVANQGSNNLSAFSIDSTGALTALTTSTFGAGTQPASLATDQAGKYLLVGNQSGSNMQVLTINSNGTLTSVASYPTGGFSASMLVMQ